MTKKHFEKIAAAFRSKLDPHAYEQNPVRTACLRDVASELCQTFKDINPAFDRERFMTACGFEP